MAGSRRRTQMVGMGLGCLAVGGRVAAAAHSIAWGVIGTLGTGAFVALVAVLGFRSTRRRLAELPADVAEVRGSVDASCLPWPWPALVPETMSAMSGQQSTWPPVVLAVEGHELTVTKPSGRPFRAAVSCAAVRGVTVGDPGWADVRLTFALADGSELRVRASAPPSAAEAIAERFRHAIERAAGPQDAARRGLRVTSPPPPWRTPPRRAVHLWFAALPVGFAGVVGIADAPFAGTAGITLMVLAFVGFLVRPRWLGRGIAVLAAATATAYLVDTYRTGAAWRLAAVGGAGALAWWAQRADRRTATEHADLRRALVRSPADPAR